MRKYLALLVAAGLLLCACGGLGESARTPYDALSALLAGKTYTLTLHAEEAEGLEDYLAPYGDVTCALYQEGDRIVLTAACQGEAYLNAAADASGFRIETNLPELLEEGALAATWQEMAATVSLTESEEGKDLTLRMTRPDHGMITIRFSIQGLDPAEYTVDTGLSIMNPDGTFISVFDTASASGGASARESVISVISPEASIEGEGEETVTQGENAVILTRRDTYTVTYDYEEIGTVTVVSQLVIAQ